MASSRKKLASAKDCHGKTTQSQGINSEKRQRLGNNKDRRALLIEQIRDKLIDRLDRAAVKGPLKDLLDRLLPDDGMEVYQSIAYALFVEAFETKEEIAGKIEGLVPLSFGATIETDAIEAFAKTLASVNGSSNGKHGQALYDPLPVYQHGQKDRNGAES